MSWWSRSPHTRKIPVSKPGRNIFGPFLLRTCEACMVQLPRIIQWRRRPFGPSKLHRTQSHPGPLPLTLCFLVPLTLKGSLRGNLASPIRLTRVSLDCGRKPEDPGATHTDTGRTCKLNTDSDPSLESHPGLCETAVLTNVPLCRPPLYHHHCTTLCESRCYINSNAFRKIGS